MPKGHPRPRSTDPRVNRAQEQHVPHANWSRVSSRLELVPVQTRGCASQSEAQYLMYDRRISNETAARLK